MYFAKYQLYMTNGNIWRHCFLNITSLNWPPENFFKVAKRNRYLGKNFLLHESDGTNC